MLLTLMIVWIASANAQDVIRYNGSSTILKAIMYQSSKAFAKQEGIKFDLKGKSTGFGIKKLLAGECDIAGGGRPLKKEEKQKGLVETKVFMDAVAFIVHKSNPVKEITSGQIKDIMLGKLVSWDKMGGPKGKKIIILSPPADSSHFKSLKKSAGFEKLPKNSMSIDMTPNVYKKVKAFPVSIGWLSYSTVKGKKDIKILDVIHSGAKVAISQENISSGKYPYHKTMFFYTKGEPTGSVKKFIEFIQGKKGETIIVKAGFFLAG